MFVIKSILNKAGAVWVVESMALHKRDAERLVARRRKLANGTHRYKLERV